MAKHQHGGRSNEEREGDFDREGTLKKEEGEGRRVDGEYDRMMDVAKTTGDKEWEEHMPLPKVKING
jgi:hypothetical protein